MKSKSRNKASCIKGRNKQDIGIVFFFALLGMLLGHLLSNDNIGFVVAFIGVFYGLLRANKDNRFAFFMMLVLGFDFFGLVPNLIIGSGTLHWYDVNVLFALLLSMKCLRKKTHTRFGAVFAVYFVFLIIACYQSMTIYNQSVFSTIGTARTTFVYLGYWPLVCLIKDGKLSKNEVSELFEYVCKIAIICYFVQFIGVNLGFDLTYLPTKVRWGTRVYINFSYIIIFYFYNLYYLIYKSNEERKGHALWLCLSLGAITIVAQSRASILYMAIVSIISVIVSLKPGKILKYTILAFVALAVLLVIPTTRNIIISSAIEFSSNDEGTIAYRVVETNYYNNQLSGHELFGVGVPNNHAANSIIYSGKTIDWSSKKFGEYYLSDLGAYKIRYQFGIIAYVLYFAYLVVVCIVTIKYRYLNSMVFLGVFSCIYLILNSSLLELLTREPFVFMLIILFLEIGIIGDQSENEISAVATHKIFIRRRD